MKMGLPARKLDRHYTYRDYRSWPEDERWELVDGVAWNMSAAPGVNHQGLVTELGRQIGNQLSGKPCRVYAAPTDVFLPADLSVDEDDVDTVVQPDILVICDRSRVRPNGIWGPPDWVIEIISPWTAKKDLAEKFAVYERTGVREYWTVDPGARSLVVYVPGEATGGARRYGDGKVYPKPRKVACTAVEGVEVDFEAAFASLLI
jgi:Uma2 family endonuclease